MLLSPQTLLRRQPIIFFLAVALPSAAIFAASGVSGDYENRQLGSMLFLAAGSMSFIVFFQEMYAFYVTNSRRLLWMSAAFFTLGVGMLGSSVAAGGNMGTDRDTYVGDSELLRVTSEFAAAVFILMGTLRSDRSIQGNMEFKAYIAVATITVLVASAITYLSTVQDTLSVPLYSSEYGWSPFSLYVELNVFVFFAAISIVCIGISRKNRSQILFWFIIGFVLMAFSELAFTMERLLMIGPASSFVWLGKAFLLTASATFVLGLSKAR
jgi:hypothetical protein